MYDAGTVRDTAESIKSSAAISLPATTPLPAPSSVLGAIHIKHSGALTLGVSFTAAAASPTSFAEPAWQPRAIARREKDLRILPLRLFNRRVLIKKFEEADTVPVFTLCGESSGSLA
jgi:hypothetical protein